jgi:transcriptional regulator with XRE-family HTH domain
MTSPAISDAILEDGLAQPKVRRAFSARLDMCLKRARLTTLQVARYVGVSSDEVALWRAGVTVPGRQAYRRLSELLRVDAAWLCIGAT